MKNRIIFLLALAFAVISCEKDFTLNENASQAGRNNDVLLETSELVLPFKATFTTVPDYSAEFVQCVPVEYEVEIPNGGLLKGNATHVGKINAAMSQWTVTECQLGPGPTQITEHISGIITAANGDYYNFGGFATIDVATNSLSGEMHFLDGTGKFAGVSGTITLSGTADAQTAVAEFTGEGFIIFPK